jgi:hypothetical protein
MMATSNRYNLIKNKDGIRKMLPDSGKSVFGNIIHSMLDWAYGNNDGDGNLSNAFERWDALVQRMDERLLVDPINAHLAPLSSKTRNYMQRRGQICRMVTKKRKSRLPIPDIPPNHGEDRRVVGPEVVVQDDITNPRITGRIDYIIEEGSDVHIIDWKTGEILEDDGDIKNAYVVQLQLYAALLERKQSDLGYQIKFPTKALLINLERGVEITLSSDVLNPLTCRQMLEEAVEMWENINKLVDKSGDAQGLMKTLAKPDNEGCQYCPVRPVCKAYLSSLQGWMSTVPIGSKEVGVKDVTGEFISKHNAGPTASTGAIILRDADKREWRIADVDFAASRNFDAVNNAKPGDRISIFNVTDNPKCEQPGYIHAKVYEKSHIVYCE